MADTSQIRFGTYIPSMKELGPLDEKIIVEYARTAEKFSFDSIWFVDGHEFLYPSPDPLIALTWCAAHTVRLKLGTGILIAPLRNANVIAHMTATIDHLSKGRFILGVGTGWNLKKYNACGVPFETRASRLRETVKIVRMLWTQDNINYVGKFHLMEDMSMGPRPFQKPSPPIWLAGTREGSLKMVARLADGWLSSLNTPPDDYRMRWNQIISAAKQMGRDPREIVPANHVFTYVDSSHATAIEKATPIILSYFANSSYTNAAKTAADIERTCLVGTPRECISRIEKLMAAGTRYLIIWPLTLDTSQLELYHEEIIPHFT